jgi:DNA-binding transcriptional regulator YhcF (GntR family)
MPISQRFKISPTSRGAIFKLKRWFYLNFFTKAPADIREKNRQVWLEFSRRLIEEINKRGASDKPARITLEYEKGTNDEFLPLSATVELMEIKPLEVFTIELKAEKPAEERKVEVKKEEVEALKTQLSQLVKKAQELGLSVEELIKG